MNHGIINTTCGHYVAAGDESLMRRLLPAYRARKAKYIDHDHSYELVSDEGAVVNDSCATCNPQSLRLRQTA